MKLRKLHRRLLWQFDLEVDSVPIREERVSFAYRELFEGKVQMMLPSHFTKMPEELAHLRYLSEHRPQLILTGKDLTENIGMNCVERDGLDLEKALITMRDSVRQTAPESVFYETAKVTAKNCEGYWFEYKSFTITDDAYNLQFLLGSEQTILLGVFNCCIRNFDEWKPFIIKALDYTEISDRTAAF
ncbi:MAG: hypothetical protein LBH09_08010 [Peptococcaceae bacterium]|nr:hypothetical protein [Peptococcaceae bacterium]